MIKIITILILLMVTIGCGDNNKSFVPKQLNEGARLQVFKNIVTENYNWQKINDERKLRETIANYVELMAYDPGSPMSTHLSQNMFAYELDVDSTEFVGQPWIDQIKKAISEYEGDRREAAKILLAKVYMIRSSNEGESKKWVEKARTIFENMLSNPDNRFHNNCLMQMLYIIDPAQEGQNYTKLLDCQTLIDPKFSFRAEYIKRKLKIKQLRPTSWEWTEAHFDIFQLAMSQPIAETPLEEDPWPTYVAFDVIMYFGPVDRQVSACKRFISVMNDANDPPWCNRPARMYVYNILCQGYIQQGDLDKAKISALEARDLATGEDYGKYDGWLKYIEQKQIDEEIGILTETRGAKSISHNGMKQPE